MQPLVAAARALAIELHEQHGHTRADGEPYWRHPERVVATLVAYGQGMEIQAAGWLHDIPEDCSADVAHCEQLLREIESRFGAVVAQLTREVTNYFPPGATMEEKQQRLVEHAAHMSPGAKWIKLADRRDNVFGMSVWPAEKRRRYASATLRLLEALRPVPAGAEILGAEIRQRAGEVLGQPAD